MSPEPLEWIKARRRSRFGGIHVYINAEALLHTLKDQGIPFDANLKIKAYPIRNKKQKGCAQILLKIREI